jgi:hypothetical protein
MTCVWTCAGVINSDRLDDEDSALVASDCACPLALNCVGMSYHARDPIWGLGLLGNAAGPDVWRVMYRRYYIPEAQAGDYAMLRAAEVVKAAGYRYFVVENERSSAAVMGGGYGYIYGGSGSVFVGAYSYPESGLLVRGAFGEVPRLGVR